MLTRLKVSGFKNLVGTEVRFGPFTCIAGFNGVGKSNLFDAIQFLSSLADHPFLQAASMVRGGLEFTDLFTAGGDGRMSFECDMLIPRVGLDDFRQRAKASQTFLTYNLTLVLDEGDDGRKRIRLEEERLSYIRKSDARARLGFAHSSAWRDSVVHTSQRRRPFISTDGDGVDRVIWLSSDKMGAEDTSHRGGGRPSKFHAASLPRTVLSAAQNADEARTAVLARAEMRSWANLQLEPSALRKPDDLHAPSSMDARGEHLPATLYRLASESDDSDRVYAQVANRLAELVDNVRDVRVRRDDVRRSFQLVMKDRRGVELPASSLSDGTLRFIALSVLERDPTVTGLLCLEEPENGIHPERMGAMMELLQDLATDVEEPVDLDNPLRQLVISTHSPVVASRVAPSDLVFADHREAEIDSTVGVSSLAVRPVGGTWRASAKSLKVAAVSKGDIVRYLGAIRPERSSDGETAWASVATELGQLELFGSGE